MAPRKKKDDGDGERSPVIVEAPVRHDLPESRDGRKPIGMKSSLLGTSSRVTSAHEIGDTLVLVVEAKVKSSGHDDTDDGLMYAEKYKTIDLYELHGDKANQALSAARQEYRERNGEPPLGNGDTEPFRGSEVKTDGAGVVMTDAERAEAVGDIVERETERPPTDEEIAGARADREAAEEMLAGRQPFPGYDAAPARTVVLQLKESTDRDLVLAVAGYEEGKRGRQTIIDAAMQRAADLQAAG